MTERVTMSEDAMTVDEIKSLRLRMKVGDTPFLFSEVDALCDAALLGIGVCRNCNCKPCRCDRAEPPSEAALMVCGFCHAEFSTDDEIVRHVRAMHSQPNYGEIIGGDVEHLYDKFDKLHSEKSDYQAFKEVVSPLVTPSPQTDAGEVEERIKDIHLRRNLTGDEKRVLITVEDYNFFRSLIERQAAEIKKTREDWAKDEAENEIIRNEAIANDAEIERQAAEIKDALALLDEVLSEVDCYTDDWAERRQALSTTGSRE